MRDLAMLGPAAASAIAGAGPLAGSAPATAGKRALGVIGKDAYKKIKDWFRKNDGAKMVALLEADPASELKHELVARFVDAQTEKERNALRVLVQILNDELRKSRRTIGLDLSDLKGGGVALANFAPRRDAIGARMKGAADVKMSATGGAARGPHRETDSASK